MDKRADAGSGGVEAGGVGGSVPQALPPEQWAELQSIGFAETEYLLMQAQYGGVMLEQDDVDLWVGDHDRHALAAVALHRQPFGFTHEDVDRLVDLAVHGVDGYGFETRTRPLMDLARRIAALLPPVTPTQ